MPNSTISPVGDAQLLAEVEREDELLEEAARDLLGQALPGRAALVLYHVLEHVAARRELHHDRQVGGGQEDLRTEGTAAETRAQPSCRPSWGERAFSMQKQALGQKMAVR